MAESNFVIVDRDGVINHDSENYIKTPDECTPIAGSLEAIADLTRAGVNVIVLTNQANIGRGVMSWDTLESIHVKLTRALAGLGGRIERFYVCPHRPEDGCGCRKPQPGLLFDAARDYGFELAATPFVGDSIRDLEAARSANARPVLVRTGNGTETEARGALPSGTRVYDDLATFAKEFT